MTAGGDPAGAQRPLENRRLRFGIIAVALVGACAAVVVSIAVGGPALIAEASSLPLTALSAVMALNLVSWLGEAVVFAALADRLRPRDVARMVAVYVGGGFPALVTPFGSGGIPGWTWALTREGLGVGEAAAVVGARAMVTGVFCASAGVVAAVALPAQASGASGGAWWGVLALAVVIAGTAALVARPERAGALAGRLLGGRAIARVAGRERARRLAETAARETLRFAAGLRVLLLERPGALAVAVLGLAVSRACLLAVMPVLLAGLGWHGDVLPVLATLLGVWVLASASPTPGGSGAVEAGMTAALSQFAPLAVAGAAALLWRGMTFYFDLLVGWALFSRYLARDGGGPAKDPAGGAGDL